MEKQIVTFPAEELKAPAKKGTEISAATVLIKTLKTAVVTAQANWLSAKHLGENIQIGIVRSELKQGKFSDSIVIIEPEIIGQSGPYLSRMEADVSFPNLKISVLRRAEVELKFIDEAGNSIQRKFNGPMARSVLQLTDQLEGNLMIEHVNGHRKRSIKGYLKRLEKFNNQDSQENKRPQQLIENE